MNDEGNSGGGAIPTARYDQTTQLARQPPLKVRLEMAVQQTEDRLVAVKRARELVAKNPDLEELLNIIQWCHF